MSGVQVSGLAGKTESIGIKYRKNTQQHMSASTQRRRQVKDKQASSHCHIYGGGGSSSSSQRQQKVSLNHLLNFSLPPRQRTPVQSRRSKPKSGSSNQFFNKERFVNANFRFMVKQGGDYTVQLVDPDVPIEWSDIEQVLMTTSNIPSCPICLTTPPLAPHITKCGHSFCYHCVLQYLTLDPYDPRVRGNDEYALALRKRAWRKCPICFESVYEKDLRSVRFYSVLPILKSNINNNINRYNTDGFEMQDKLVFCLMQRAPQSVLVAPRTNPLSTTLMPPSCHTLDAITFAKILLADPAYVLHDMIARDLETLQREQQDTQSMLSAMELSRRERGQQQPSSSEVAYARELVFVEMAITRLKEKRTQVKGSASAIPYVNTDRTTKTQASINSLNRVNKRDYHTDMSLKEQASDPLYAHGRVTIDSSDESVDEKQHDNNIVLVLPSTTNNIIDKSTSKQSGHTNVKPGHTKQSRQQSLAVDGTLYFFQVADGQHYYLHPLENKILKQEYGSYQNFPDIITVPVQSVQESTLDEDMRKKCHHLSHVPTGCDIGFVEVDLSSVVSTTTMDKFRNELEERNRQHHTRHVNEERLLLEAEKRMQRQETPRGHQFIAMGTIETDSNNNDDDDYDYDVGMFNSKVYHEPYNYVNEYTQDESDDNSIYDHSNRRQSRASSSSAQRLATTTASASITATSTPTYTREESTSSSFTKPSPAAELWSKRASQPTSAITGRNKSSSIVLSMEDDQEAMYEISLQFEELLAGNIDGGTGGGVGDTKKNGKKKKKVVLSLTGGHQKRRA